MAGDEPTSFERASEILPPGGPRTQAVTAGEQTGGPARTRAGYGRGSWRQIVSFSLLLASIAVPCDFAARVRPARGSWMIRGPEAGPGQRPPTRLGYPMSISHRVRTLRHAKGLSPDELASRAQISRTALYQIESGKTTRPRASTVRKLAEALGVLPRNLHVEPGPGAGDEDHGREEATPWPGSPPAPPPGESGGSPDLLTELELERKFRLLLRSTFRDSIARVVEDTFRRLGRDQEAPRA